MMNLDAEVARIQDEYSRRERELPAGRYAWSRPVNLFFHHGIVRSCIRALASHDLFPLTGCSIADVGCGTGTWLLEYLQWGAEPSRLAGIDLQATRIEMARRRLPTADLHAGNAACLPWPDATFDLVSQFMLFSSVLRSPMKLEIATEMLRVLKPGGVILWYDFRYDNPRNRQVQGIEAAEIRSLFAPCPVDLTKVTLAPPLARAIVPLSLPLSHMLESVPWLCTHYVGIVTKPV